MKYRVVFDGVIDGIRTKDTRNFETKADAMRFGKELRKQHDNKQCMILVVKDCPEEVTSINYTGYKKHA